MSLSLSDPSLLKSQAYVDGQWIDADDGATFPVTNPANGELITNVAKLGAAETARAVAAADAAMQSWKKQPAKARAGIIRKWYDLMMANQEDLAQIMTAEQGKVIAESRGEIAYGAAFVEWFGEEAKRIDGDVIPGPSSDKRIVCIKQPVGVVAAITPWNFPNAMIARKAAPALAAGCSIVIKPATETPLSAFAMVELAERAGVPAGVINVIAGSSAAIGGELTANPVVRKLTFTGSTPVGKMLTSACADTMKKTSMELGGNAPFIVFDDADIDAAIEGAMIAKYRNMGQTCVCTNRFYVQAGIHDAFVARLKEATEAMLVGDGADDGVVQGPMIDMAGVEKVEEMIADATAKGGKVISGGKRHAKGGTFFEPTVITAATADMQFATEEIFGPLSAVFKFDTEEEVIAAANATEFGLAAYAYTKSLGRTFRLNDALQYGLIGINSGLITTVEAPFGGLKESGMGKEGGSQGLEDYLSVKYMCVAGLDD